MSCLQKVMFLSIESSSYYQLKSGREESEFEKDMGFIQELVQSFLECLASN